MLPASSFRVFTTESDSPHPEPPHDRYSLIKGVPGHVRPNDSCFARVTRAFAPSSPTAPAERAGGSLVHLWTHPRVLRERGDAPVVGGASRWSIIAGVLGQWFNPQKTPMAGEKPDYRF